MAFLQTRQLYNHHRPNFSHWGCYCCGIITQLSFLCQHMKEILLKNNMLLKSVTRSAFETHILKTLNFKWHITQQFKCFDKDMYVALLLI